MRQWRRLTVRLPAISISSVITFKDVIQAEPQLFFSFDVHGLRQRCLNVRLHWKIRQYQWFKWQTKHMQKGGECRRRSLDHFYVTRPPRNDVWQNSTHQHWEWEQEREGERCSSKHCSSNGFNWQTDNHKDQRRTDYRFKISKQCSVFINRLRKRKNNLNQVSQHCSSHKSASHTETKIRCEASQKNKTDGKMYKQIPNGQLGYHQRHFGHGTKLSSLWSFLYLHNNLHNSN